jgi:hypothetical protein
MEVQVEARWRKSSYSGNGGGTCVEVGQARRSVLVRDTKQTEAGPVLQFTPAAWRRFADQIKRSLAQKPYRGSVRYRAERGEPGGHSRSASRRRPQWAAASSLSPHAARSEAHRPQRSRRVVGDARRPAVT